MLVEGIRCFPLEERPFFRTVGNIPLFVDHSILPIVAIQFGSCAKMRLSETD